ncbi:hypothetical protein WJX74_010238 [Apatococcus lobatus]|uniref:ATP synthase subunit 5, mitochondrial n=1 Tax=Apatococcus lobatus TaxID=904363 RepID=A0AAW1R3U1_9CHLO
MKQFQSAAPSRSIKQATLPVALASRGFAATAVPAQAEVQAPLTLHGSEGRYASALYCAAARTGDLDAVDDDMCGLYDLANESEEFHAFLTDPLIHKSQRLKILDSLLEGQGVNELTKSFLGVLAENNRLGEFAKISDSFDELMDAARGHVNAIITTASEVEQEEIDEISDGLMEMLEEGQSLNVETKIDPAILGGLVIDIGDRHVDLSVLARLKQVQAAMVESL